MLRNRCGGMVPLESPTGVCGGTVPLAAEWARPCGGSGATVRRYGRGIAAVWAPVTLYTFNYL